jgi:hypothetical protein
MLGSEELSPRHLMFVLPIWTTFVAAGAATVPARIVVASALVAIAVLAPAAVTDPRTTPSTDAAPVAWLRTQLEPGDVLYPYSPLFLAALPEAAKARALPREPLALARALRRTDEVRKVFVAIPLREPLRRRVPGAYVFRSWLILEEHGPFSRLPRLLARVAPVLKGTSAYASVLQLRGAACRC